MSLNFSLRNVPKTALLLHECSNKSILNGVLFAFTGGAPYITLRGNWAGCILSISPSCSHE
jgi:hypothetical protein